MGSHKLIEPDHLVLTTKADLESQTPSRYLYYSGTVESRSESLDIRVAPKNIMRSLVIMNNIIKGLEEKGHSVQVDHRETYAIVYSKKIKISLREKMKRVKNAKGIFNDNLFPDNSLLLKVGWYSHGKEWKDGKQEKLEDKIDDILTWLVAEGLRLKIQSEEYEREREENEKLKEAYEAQKKLERDELERFKILLEESGRWHQTKLLNEYYNYLKESNHDDQYLEWVKQKIEWVNPTINRDDPLLRRVDKRTLSLNDDDKDFF